MVNVHPPFVVGFSSPLSLCLAAGFSSVIETGISHPEKGVLAQGSLSVPTSTIGTNLNGDG
jgi:hypothetical protein